MAKFKKQCSSGDKASRYILLLNVTLGTGNVTTNKTPVSYNLQLAGGNYDGDNYNQYGSSFYGYTCNGTIKVKNKKTGTTLKTSTGSSKGSVSNTSAITIASGSFDAPHNDDGTLTLSFEGTFSGGLSTQASGGSVSGDVTLTTIKRANKIYVTEATIEGDTNITIEKNSDDFTTTITYKFGELEDTIVEKTSAETKSWTIPESFYSQIPEDPYGYCTLTATTYSGSSVIGTTTKEFKVTADPDKCRPTATITAIDSNETTKSLTDGEGNVVVIGKSNILCTIEKSIVEGKGAEITSVKVNGVELNDLSKVTFNNANTNVFEVIVEDARGYTNNNDAKKVTLGKVDYFDVSINAEVVRNTPTDGKVNISFSGKYFKGSFGNTDNELDVQYMYKEKGATEYSTPIDLTATINEDNTYSGSVKEIEGFDYEKEYVFQVIATDKLSTAPKTSVEIPINKGKPMWWYDEEAFRILNNLLIKDRDVLSEIGLLSSLSTSDKSSMVNAINELVNSIKNVTDIDSYSFSNNGYIRFKNGFQIAWNTQQQLAGGTLWTNNIYYSDHSMGDWVKPFTTCYIAIPYCNNSTFWTGMANASITSAGNLRCFRPNNGTANVWMGSIGFGKWK